MTSEQASDWEPVELTLPNPRQRQRWEPNFSLSEIRAAPTITLQGMVRRGTIGETPVLYVRVLQTPETAYTADQIYRVRFLAPGGTLAQRALLLHHSSHRSYLTKVTEWSAFADVIFDDAFWLDLAALLGRA